MGSSRSEYYRDKITFLELKGPATEMAWKKIGFKDLNDLKNHVRELPVERRMDLLTEHFINELSTMYLRDRMRFMEGIGKTITVSKEELLEYAARVYPSFEVDTMWLDQRYVINPVDFSIAPQRKL